MPQVNKILENGLSKLDKVFDYWLPNNLSDKVIDLARLNLFIRVISTITVVGFFTSSFTVLIMPDWQSRLYFIGTAGLSAGLYLLILFIVKRTGNINFAYNIGATIAVLFMTRLVFESGGIYSTSILSIWIILIASFFIASIRTGITWSIITIFYIAFFYFLDINDIKNFKPELDTPLRRVVDLIFITSYISFVLVIYEKNRKGLLLKMKNAHDEQKKQNKALIEINREKETLMAIVAHDLKSPQNQLLGILKLVEMELKANNQSTEYIEMGKNIVKGSLHLINDITYTKEITNGFLVEKKEGVEIGSFVEEQISGFEYAAKEKNISIVKDIKTNGLSIQIDKTILARIFQNLISNALKFSPFGKSIYISTILSNSEIIFSIRDEGPGIDKEERKLLFKRFQKLSARPTNKESSSGLGLFIVKTLVDKIGAQVKVISEQGKGAEFVLVLSLNH
jgi:signal transduction histidine kinase